MNSPMNCIAMDSSSKAWTTAMGDGKMHWCHGDNPLASLLFKVCTNTVHRKKEKYQSASNMQIQTHLFS